MTGVHHFLPTGPVLVRAATDAPRTGLPEHFDLGDDHAVVGEGRAWLEQLRGDSEAFQAIAAASPQLAAAIERITNANQPVPARSARRTILAAAAYLARWQRRTTPFALFAGINTAEVGGGTAARFGAEHLAVARPDAEWLSTLVQDLERHAVLRAGLSVCTDGAGFVRDGRFIVAGPPVSGAAPGPLLEISAPYTPPVAAAVGEAAVPIRLADLVDRLAVRFPAAERARIAAMLDTLIDHHVLVTSLRAPMTEADPLAHLIDALREAGGTAIHDVAQVIKGLEHMAALLAAHNTTSGDAGPRLRAEAVAVAERLARTGSPALAVDVRLDAEVRLPAFVLDEAGIAAELLAQLGTKPFGSTAWSDYHARFRARYGEGAHVPVRDLVSASGLGYPTGFMGAPRARPSWRGLTERDAVLLGLVQRAALERVDEIDLTETDIKGLTVGDHTTAVYPRRIELGFEIHAASTDDVDRGAFHLWVTAAPRAHTSMAGRFSHLLASKDREALAASYRGCDDDTDVVQLSFPPRRAHNGNVVRVPALLSDVLPLSEHPGEDVEPVDLDSLTVTADDAHFYIIDGTTGRQVAPRVLHALDVKIHTPPLARFLAEIADARALVFGPFDPGAARALPHLPRIRRGRIILSPATWQLSGSELVGAQFETAYAAWSRRWRVPDRVVLRQGELALPLDLRKPLDRALLRSRVAKADRTVRLEEAPAPEAFGWIGRRLSFSSL